MNANDDDDLSTRQGDPPVRPGNQSNLTAIVVSALFACGAVGIAVLGHKISAVLVRHDDSLPHWFVRFLNLGGANDRGWPLAGAMVVLFTIVALIWMFRFINAQRGVKPFPIGLISFIFIGVVAIIAGATWWLFHEAAQAPVNEQVKLRSDAIKTALLMLAGSTGVGTLILAFRSHFTSESDRMNAQIESAANKLTDESEVIQITGLLALERLAYKHAAYRYAVHHILVAYLPEAGRHTAKLASQIYARSSPLL